MEFKVFTSPSFFMNFVRFPLQLVIQLSTYKYLSCSKMVLLPHSMLKNDVPI